jgi:hypothetical protein
VAEVGQAICQPTDSAFYPIFPIWAADPPLDSTAKGFCEDAWSHFRKPGRDPVPLATTLSAAPSKRKEQAGT